MSIIQMAMSSVIPSPPSNGLMMYLDAGNRSSYPGSGSSWNDLTGNGYNASLTDQSFLNDNQGQILFNGVTTSANVAFSNTLTSTTWIVWARWIKPQSPYPTIDYTHLIGDGDNRLMILYDRLMITWGSGLQFLTDLYVPNNEWFMASFVVSPTQARVYLNTAEWVNNNSYGSKSFTSLYMSPFGSQIAGAMAMALVYNRALSAAEISRIYYSFGSRYATAPTLVNIPVNYLVVAGGGGGGMSGDGGGGGGGGGGLIDQTSSTVNLVKGLKINVGVGAGGVGSGQYVSGSSGDNSFFGASQAIGGGLGATLDSGDNRPATSGGSGGGQAGAGYLYPPGNGTSGQGSEGGYGNNSLSGGAGGGGGYLSAGGGATSTDGGNGGTAGTFNIPGIGTDDYGGGGGGGEGQEYGGNPGTGGGNAGSGGAENQDGTSATINRGGGGGGGGGSNATGSNLKTGGNGGSGIVYIWYPDTYDAATVTGTPNIIVTGGYRIYEWTGTGSMVI